MSGTKEETLLRRNREAYSYLEQVEKLDAIIKNKLIERQQWMEIALGITANMDGERVQSSGRQSKMADAVDKCIDIDAEIDEMVDSLIDAKREVIKTIESLDSPIEYNVLHMRYIQYVDLQGIADYYRKDYGWATTTHGRAIAKVQKMLEHKKVCDLV
jgi:hypothetical protein